MWLLLFLALFCQAQPSVRAIVEHYAGLGPRAEIPVDPEPMYVIGAGLGRTGTSSLVKALSDLGLKPYHMKEGVFETPGHIDAWDIFTADMNAGRTGDVGALMDLFAQDGFNATTDFPTCLIYKELLNRYPNARVVLTVRSSGEAWAKSVRATIGIYSVTKRMPWKWIPPFNKQVELEEWMFTTSLKMKDPITGDFPAAALAKVHNDWIETVKSDVPPEKLLIFQAKEGYEPLCKFISPLSDSIRAKCNHFLEVDEPFPHTNDTKAFQNMIMFFHYIALVFEYGPLVLVVILCYFVYKRFGQKKTTKTA